jgi:hypothetical protein
LGKERLLAMTDGVVAIIITIMVLELKVPEGASFKALAELWPVFFSYVISFIYVAVYWNNHHHYFHLVHRVNGAVLWANFNLLFWLAGALRHRLDGRTRLRAGADRPLWRIAVHAGACLADHAVGDH